MISTFDIAWAAGFLEGEGSFFHNSGSCKVSAGQVQKEPLDRLVKFFGGVLSLRRPIPGAQPFTIWSVNARRSVQVMMTLYPLMSPKRQQEIRGCLSAWRNTARILKSHDSNYCGRGHLLEGYNAVPRGKNRSCRKCKNSVRQIWRHKRKAAGLRAM